MKYTWLVEKYLEGELSGEALRKFELEILRKPEVAEEVERVRSMTHFMKEQHRKFQDSIGLIEDYEDSENIIDEEIIRQDLNGLKVKKISAGQHDIIDLKTKLTEAKLSHTLSNQRSNKILVRKISVWLAAASVAFLMFTSISLVIGKSGTPDYMAVYEKHFSAPYADLPSRSALPGIDDAYIQALGQYNQAEYGTAYQLFLNIPDESVNNLHHYLYKGISAMKVGDFQMALECFAKLQSDPVLKHEGMWYMGLSYIAIEDIPSARQILEEIVAGDGFYKKQAKHLLRSI
jgi:hypothetical protein